MTRRDLIQKLLQSGNLDDEMKIEIITYHPNRLQNPPSAKSVDICHVFQSRPTIQVEVNVENP